MPSGVVQEPVNLKFVVDFAEDYVPVVLSENRTPLQLRIGVDRDGQKLACLAIRLHRCGHGSEMGDRVFILLCQLVEIPDFLHGAVPGDSLIVPIPLDDGQVRPARFF
jgi:hypothetical protein